MDTLELFGVHLEEPLTALTRLTSLWLLGQYFARILRDDGLRHLQALNVLLYCGCLISAHMQSHSLQMNASTIEVHV
eukprot:scaffold259199_cov14-Prasinocladus_malaysianus.AAC.2